jgi:NAD(P)H dehydrogenase (quinone)
VAQVLIVYFSHGGNTRKMAEALALVIENQGCRAVLKGVEQAGLEDLRQADGLLLGSPCYFGTIAAPMKAFIDESIKLYGKGELEGKPGGAFCSTGGIGGGGELTTTALTHAMLIHGMLVQGIRKMGHFGPVAIGAPDDRVLEEIERYGTRFAGLVKKLAG